MGPTFYVLWAMITVSMNLATELYLSPWSHCVGPTSVSARRIILASYLSDTMKHRTRPWALVIKKWSYATISCPNAPYNVYYKIR